LHNEDRNYILQHISLGRSNKEGGDGMAIGNEWERREVDIFQLENVKGRHNLGQIGVCGRIILKYTPEK